MIDIKCYVEMLMILVSQTSEDLDILSEYKNFKKIYL